MSRRTARRRVQRWTARGDTAVRPDTLAAEEPLEIRIDGEPFTVTMRTPGDDMDLVLGFLVSEGIIRSAGDVRTAAYCAGAVEDDQRDRRGARSRGCPAPPGAQRADH
jgi:FdhD protein